MIKNIILAIIFLLFINIQLSAQNNKHAKKYWQTKIQLTPFRLPLPQIDAKINYIDLDHDGDPDVLRTVVNGFPVQWIDDDDDMKYGDVEGDMDSDCLMVDRNKDGKYGSEYDLIIDWDDEDGDNVADLQVVVDYSGFDDRGLWKAHYMWFIDTDHDQQFNYIDWNTMQVEGWEHSGRSNFFPDYLGNSIFLKVHTNTFNINDLRYNWENPFLFYDPDNDGLTEMSIRYIDSPKVIKGMMPVSKNENINKIEPSVLFTKRITSVQIGIDLDNDSSPANEFDYDMSIKFSGKGFDYSDQVHKYKSLRGLPEADKYFFDPRWRQLDELIYTDHEKGYKFPFERGKWNECWFVYDEDDDCQRWERVEFYSPKDLFKVGAKNGGLDNNPQADVSGDRGEWDMDFSGKGKLYIGKFDGRIHLYGAEWGAWRIDQNAKYFQGWQGWRGKNLQPEDFIFEEPKKFATVKYLDTDDNGFFDLIEYDLDGDTTFETKVNLLALGISDSSSIIDISHFKYKDFNNLYLAVANHMWKNANDAVKVASEHGLNVNWYSQFMHPLSPREKYNDGYWLSFYLYKDLKYLAELKKDKSFSHILDVAYYSGNWNSLTFH